MSRIVFFSLLTLSLVSLTACSTNFDTSSVEGADQKRIYQIEQSRAFQIAHDSIASVLPGRKITKVAGPTKGYSTYSRFMLDTYTQQVLVIPLEGKTSDGEVIEGFNLNVSGSGTSIMIGRSKNIDLYEEVESRLAQTGSGVLVTQTQRGSYDLPVFGPSSSADQNAQPNRRSERERLEELKELREDGLITEEDYNEKRDEILEGL